jgi:hypothetical protein
MLEEQLWLSGSSMGRGGRESSIFSTEFEPAVVHLRGVLTESPNRVDKRNERRGLVVSAVMKTTSSLTLERSQKPS